MGHEAIERARTAIDQARVLLSPVTEPARANPLATLGASALAAVAAVLMAGAFILGPGVTVQQPTATDSQR